MALASSGKTTFAYKMFGERALFVSTEVGYRGLKGIKAVNITKWSDIAKLNRQLKDPRAKKLYDVLVIDTVDLLWSLCESQVLALNSVNKIGDIAYGAGFKMIDDLFADIIVSWQRMGYTMMFISHSIQREEEVEYVDGTKQKIEKYVPTLARRGFNILNKFVDNIFYVGMIMDENNKEQRVLFTREKMNYKAGSRWGYLDEVIPLNPEIVNQKILEAIEKEDDEEYDESIFEKEKVVERTFEEVKEELTKLVMDKFYPDNMSIVTKVVESVCGIGAKVNDLTERQQDSMEAIIVKLEEELEKLNK